MLRQTIVEATGNLLASGQRSALALLGILIGAGAVIAMLNVGAIARNETIQQFQQMGTDILTVRATEPAGLDLGDAFGLAAEIPALRIVAPLVSGSGFMFFGSRSASYGIVGVTDRFAEVANLHLAQGRFISRLDRFELYCVVGSKVAEELSGPFGRVRVGSQLRVGRYVFTVIGILQPVLESPMLSVEPNAAVFFSIANTRRLLERSLVANIITRLVREADPAATADAVSAYFTAKAHGGADVQTAKQLIEGMSRQMQLFELLLGAVGSIALVLGGVGVMNIMLVSVKERHREIGIRLAVGARRRDIQLLFLTEAVILSVLGGVLGIGLGIGASYVFARFSGWTFLLAPAAAPLGAGISVVVGIFFGFYPAVLASRLNPITALQTE